MPSKGSRGLTLEVGLCFMCAVKVSALRHNAHAVWGVVRAKTLSFILGCTTANPEDGVPLLEKILSASEPIAARSFWTQN